MVGDRDESLIEPTQLMLNRILSEAYMKQLNGKIRDRFKTSALLLALERRDNLLRRNPTSSTGSKGFVNVSRLDGVP